jgi:hypothetical protein
MCVLKYLVKRSSPSTGSLSLHLDTQVSVTSKTLLDVRAGIHVYVSGYLRDEAGHSFMLVTAVLVLLLEGLKFVCGFLCEQFVS